MGNRIQTKLYEISRRNSAYVQTDGNKPAYFRRALFPLFLKYRDISARKVTRGSLALNRAGIHFRAPRRHSAGSICLFPRHCIISCGKRSPRLIPVVRKGRITVSLMYRMRLVACVFCPMSFSTWEKPALYSVRRYCSDLIIMPS